MYDIGDPVALSVTTTDSSGNPANPGAITLTVTLPDGTTATPSVTSNPVGTHTASYTTTQEGRHGVSWVATGVNLSAYADSFNVDAWRGLVSVAEAKDHLNASGITAANEEELRFHVLTASQVVEDLIGPVARRTITEVVTPIGGKLWLRPPVISVSSVTSAYGYTATYTVGDLYVDGESGVVHYGAGGSTFAYPVTVTYVAGRAVVPAPIRMAVLDLIRINWRPQQGGNYSAFDEVAGGPSVMRLGYFVPRNIEEGLLRAYPQMVVA